MLANGLGGWHPKFALTVSLWDTYDQPTTHVPVAHYHLRAKPIGKSGSANAVAAAAYRSGSRGVVASAAYRAAERLREDGGRVYDFTAKKGVEEAFILNHKDAPAWAYDRGKLWNTAEASEKRINGRVATELEISLPKELTPRQRRELIVGFIQPLVDRYKIAADIALHCGADPRNLHAHVQMTHRELGPNGFEDIACRHTIMRGDKEIPVAGITATPRDVIKLRKLWEDHVNAAYRKAGLDLTVDSRSYQEQGLDIKPQLYLGPERKDNPELERKRQERAEHNKRVMAQRAERERQALDQTHERRHQNLDAIIQGWRRAASEPAAPKSQQDHLAADLMRAITSALQTRDPAEQTERLLEGVERAVFVNTGSEDRQSKLSRSLMRVVTSALADPEPERILVAGTGEAIRRHELRQQGVEQPAPDPPTPERGHAHDQVRRPTMSPEEQRRLEHEANAHRVPSGWRELTVKDIARELSPVFDRLTRHSNHLQGEIEKARRAAAFAKGSVTRGEAAIEDRQLDMGKISKWFHRTGLWPDDTLTAAERYKQKADRVLHKREVRLSTIEGEKRVIDRRAEIALDAVRPAAEHELGERRQIAREADEILRPIREAEMAAEREQQQQRQRQGRSYGMSR